MKKIYTIPVYVPHLGARNDETIYYNTKTVVGEGRDLNKTELKKIIESFLKNINTETLDIEVSFYGRGFNQLAKEKQEELLSVTDDYIASKKIDFVRIAIKPEDFDKKDLKRFKKHGIKIIEIMAQSTNEYIINNLGRKYNLKDLKRLCRTIRFTGFKLGLHIMVGLPESTKIDELNTSNDIVKLKPKIVRIYPLAIMKNTKLEEDYNTEDYEPLNSIQAIERVKDLVLFFMNEKIEDIHIGIDNSEIGIDAKDKNAVYVAGSYEDSFRKKVETEIWYESILERIKKFNVKVKDVKLITGELNVDNILGSKKENSKKIKELYDVDIFVEHSQNINQNTFKLEILKTYDEYIEERRK